MLFIVQMVYIESVSRELACSVKTVVVVSSNDILAVLKTCWPPLAVFCSLVHFQFYVT